MNKTTALPTVVGVQYLRGLAALLVVVDHAAGIMAFTEYSGRSPGTFLIYGAVGVPIFFVISGFIIAVISLNRDLKGSLTIGEFYRRRFVRIVPFMWLCVIGYALLRLVGIGEWNWGPFFRAMFLWPIGDVRPNVIWTLRHELAFYLLFGLTMLATVRRAWILIFWFVSPVVLWTIQAIDPQIFLALPGSIQELVGFLGNKVNVCFGAGLALGLMYRRGSARCAPGSGVDFHWFSFLVYQSSRFSHLLEFHMTNFGTRSPSMFSRRLLFGSASVSTQTITGFHVLGIFWGTHPIQSIWFTTRSC